MIVLKKCWDWCVKHWKLLLVSIGGFIAFLIGYQRASRETQRVKLELDIKDKDNDLILKNKERIDKESSDTVLKFREQKAELERQYREKLKNIDNKKEETKKEVLNSDEKLDKILKDKWGLKNETK